jgi:hypothetical protein
VVVVGTGIGGSTVGYALASWALRCFFSSAARPRWRCPHPRVCSGCLDCFDPERKSQMLRWPTPSR